MYIDMYMYIYIYIYINISVYALHTIYQIRPMGPVFRDHMKALRFLEARHL